MISDPVTKLAVTYVDFRGKPTAINFLPVEDLFHERMACIFCTVPQESIFYSLDDVLRPVVIENRWPSVDAEGEEHLLVIDSQEHQVFFRELSQEKISAVFLQLKVVLEAKKENPAAGFVPLVWKNEGYDAGASQAHVHHQIKLLRRIPEDLAQELDYFNTHQCPFCVKVENVVMGTEWFTAYCPAASRPFQVRIIPRQHLGDFSHLGMTAFVDLARLVKRLLLAYQQIEGLRNMPYNIFYRLVPFSQRSTCLYHFRIDIVPRITRLGGQEIMFPREQINPFPPEYVAGLLCERLGRLRS